MFKKILIPMDGSEIAERALIVAKTLVQDVDSELLLLSVTIPHQIVAEQSGVSILYVEQAMDKSRQELSEYLQTVQRTVADLHCTVNVVVKEGDPASAIVDTAAEEGMDLIVMSTHGRSGFTRWMMGSVTTKVLHEAACPVLSVCSADPISRVLITLDGSELAEQALEPGFEVAKRLGAQVTLLKVQATSEIDIKRVAKLEKAESGLGKRLQQGVYERDETYLQKIADHYGAITGLKTRTALVDDPVAQAILHFAEERDADLVVMATHGRTGLRRWVYGSVTEKILSRAHCAMMIIRPPADKLN